MSRFDLYFVYYSTLSSLFTQFPSILCKFIEELRKFDDVNWTYVSPAGDFQTDGERTGKYILGGEDEKVTSSVLAGSIGVNPVIVRNVMGNLKEAGLISISQGKSGISLTKTPGQITFYDVYKAVDGVNEDGLFHFHENPNPECPISICDVPTEQKTVLTQLFRPQVVGEFAPHRLLSMLQHFC